MIRAAQDRLARLHAEHSPKPESPNGHHPRSEAGAAHRDEEVIEIVSPARQFIVGSPSTHRDEEVIEKARSEQGGKFGRLHSGDLSDYGTDHSRADDGYVHKLYPYTQDPEQIKRIHAASGLHRPEKSGKRVDYLERSIRRARENVSWFYDWPDEATPHLNGRKIHSAVYRDGVAAERKIRFRTAREVAAETPAQTEWAAYSYLAKGAITMIVGKIKAGGKTTWASHMAGAVLKGAPFMGRQTEQTPIVFLTEQQPASFRKVLERADLADREDLYILSWHDVAGFEWSEVARGAVEKAQEVGAGALFVDTLAQFAGIRGDGENSAGEAQRAMGPLQEAVAKGLAVAVTQHERKGGGEVGESGRGSSAFGGAVDIIVSIRRGDGNTRPTVRILESLSRFEETPDKLVIELTPEGYRSLGDATAFAEEEAREAVLEVLPSTPEHAVTMSELFDKLQEQNVKRTSAQGALHSLIADGQAQRIGAGKKGDPYRHFLCAERGAGSGGKNIEDDGAVVPNTTEIHSAATSTLYTAERKNESEPLSWGLEPGQSSTLEKLNVDQELEALLQTRPDWLRAQARKCLEGGASDRLLKSLANAVADQYLGNVRRGGEALSFVREHLEVLAK